MRTSTQHHPGSEETAIEAVVQDYIEGWDEGDVQRMDRSLHAELAKRTPANGEPDQEGELRAVTKTSMLELTAAGGGKGADSDAKIIIDDVSGEIAAARVRSRDYLDYLHLVKSRERWEIVNILFQPLS